MPVNWAFSAAQGEPESFLDPGFDSTACETFHWQVFRFAIVQSILCATCSTNFRIARSEALHSIVPIATTDYFRG